MKHLLFFLFLSGQIFAQTTTSFTRVNPYFSKSTFWLTKDSVVKVLFPAPATSAVVKISTGSAFNRAYVVAGTDTVFLKHDSHGDTESKAGSQLIVFRNPVNGIRIYSGGINGETELQIFNAGADSVKKKENNYRLSELCEEPFAVAQSEWRAGLPDPIGSPVNTPVFHIVVHHSAGSNLSADYTREVRNIYIYHTQSNGYDDIGYNYLIDPAGIIYKGRDGRGLVDQDNARGAHMCNKNDSTMAICMLGTFTNVLPTPEALSSLYNLAGWKAAKNDLDVFAFSRHSQGPTSANAPSKMLPVPAGHRDGCTPFHTECPGQMLYEHLPEVRRQVHSEKLNCIVTGLEEVEKSRSEIRINGKIYRLEGKDFKEIIFYRTDGTVAKRMPFLEDVHADLKGVFIISFLGENEARLKTMIE